MPIRPEMKGRYPADWQAIRARILERAGNACECTGQCGAEHVQNAPSLDFRCGAPNGARIIRLLEAPEWWALESEPEAELGLYGRPLRVVLTIAHLVDKRPEACDDSNLAALCQRCHLRHDHADHVRQAAETRRSRADKKAGQGRLF